MEAGRIGRAARAAMFAAVSVTLAAVGHVLMSGAPLPFWVVTAGFLAVAVPGWWAATRERGIWLVTGLAVTTQAVLHSAFATAQGLVATASAAAPARTAPLVDNLCSTGPLHDMGHASHLEQAGHMGPAGDMDATEPMSHMSHMSHMMSMNHMGSMGHMGSTGSMGNMAHDMAGMYSTGMLAAHLLAALVCGVWLARGERAAFQVLRSVAAWLLTPLQCLLTAPVPPPRPRARARRGLSDRLPRGLLCTRDLDPRGPPGGLAAL
ncbi:hypothetical protein G3I19_10670 [Streptomyces sp. SID10853]|uniref:hypothetical protein n=1 Tax=Streptomyces sp. SID10853 TaxID=2706028 RepID=UPI0013C1421A|nr:hypothetical protein [Streptomyces sp. SID10853]NDZ78980.1 hypothetical protein [Streptomyces sp. SID10853]